MRKITIIYDGSKYTYKWIKSLMWAKDEFLKLGYDVNYSSFLDMYPKAYTLRQKYGIAKAQLYFQKMQEYDILFLAFHHSTSWLGNLQSEDRIALLKDFRKRTKTLCWFDTADSTGCCLFDVLPYVDLYFKKQLLKDLNRYTAPIWGGRLFCEYYHNLTGLEDHDIERIYPTAKYEFLNKIRLSWNVGAGDLFTSFNKLSSQPYEKTLPALLEPGVNKILDFHYRGSGYSPIAGYQRRKLQELVKDVKFASHPDVMNKVPHDEYVRELKSAFAVISPFGWGEICTRDFESFIYGATLIKPSMEHCITWPNVYIPNETYIPIRWDLTDLQETLYDIGSKRFSDVAIAGQKLYADFYLGDNSKKVFAEHIVNELTKSE